MDRIYLEHVKPLSELHCVSDSFCFNVTRICVRFCVRISGMIF